MYMKISGAVVSKKILCECEKYQACFHGFFALA
jgi:hypothetical protein